MTTRASKLHRLHFLNALLAPLTGHDLYLAEQIDAAIASSFDEVKERTPADPEFVRAAAQLFERLCRQQSSHGFFHWDATSADAGGTLLFARAGLMQGLKALAPCLEATVLITNLRAAQCPPDKRWTAKRQRDYDDVLALLRQLTATRTRRGANVNLLFL